MLRMPKSYIRPIFSESNIQFVEKILAEDKINTICSAAKCPNKGECFSAGTTSFLALGNICTRNCLFCGVETRRALSLLPIDESEPIKFANATKKLNLSNVVITSPTRDDLIDGGAKHLAKCVSEIKRVNANCEVEVLIPDFGGDSNSIRTILASPVCKISHNIEMPARLYPKLRDRADFERSFNVLKFLKANSNIPIKTGFMLGLGESRDEILELIAELSKINIDILTIGQYFKPTKSSFDVQKYYEESDFIQFAEFAQSVGIKEVVAGVFVRSSYKL